MTLTSSSSSLVSADELVGLFRTRGKDRRVDLNFVVSDSKNSTVADLYQRPQYRYKLHLSIRQVFWIELLLCHCSVYSPHSFSLVGPR